MSFLNWVRARNSPLQKAAYTSAKRLLRTDAPVIPGLYWLLSAERSFRKGVLRHCFAKFYYEPLLRRQAHAVGRGLVLYENIPKIFGNLQIDIGNRVTLSGSQVWFACGDTSRKKLQIGDDSYIGFGTELFAGSEITIGRHVLIANYVLINGYDGHPIDPIARASGFPPNEDGYGAIRIDDYAWVGSRAIILKNVRIGRGAVVASGAVVTKDVPELTVVAGNPARAIRTIEAPAGWNEESPLAPSVGE